MIVLGVSILGNLNKEATSEDSLGTPFWRIVIASGIVVCILGTVNVFASYWFRNKNLGITARQVRMHGAVAPQKVYVPPPGSSCYSTPPLSAKPSAATSKGRRSFYLGRRSATLPSYHTAPQQQQQPVRNISAPIGSGAGPAMAQNRTSGVPVVYGSGAPTIVNMPEGPADYANNEKEGYAPVVNGVQRPDLAHHPALQGGRF